MRTQHNLAIISLPLWGAAVGANSTRLFQEVVPPDAVAIVVIGLFMIGTNAPRIWMPGPRRRSSTE